jgi:RNA polymerase sigma-70 factor (ECF subfamily)
VNRGIADDDRQLLARLAAREGEAVGELYDRHAAHVYALARRIVRRDSDAEDVVQEVFAQAWRSAAGYDPSRGTILGWLLIMTRTRAIDRLRMRDARPQGDSTALPGISAGSVPAIDLMIADEQRDRVRGALEELPPQQRVPLELAYYEGLSQSAIAERLSQPLGTVKTRIRMALSSLRDRLRT